MKIKRALPILDREKDTYLFLSGGVTRSGFPSEAAQMAKLIPQFLRYRVIIEDRSTSTKQNVLNMKEHPFLSFHDEEVASVRVFSTPGHEKRVRFWYERLWPDMPLCYCYVGNDTIKERIIHWVAYVLAVCDPGERVFLPFVNRFFRKLK